MTRTPRPDFDAGSGVEHDPVGVGDRLVGLDWVDAVLGDVVAAVRPISRVKHQASVLRRSTLVGAIRKAWIAESNVDDFSLSRDRFRSRAAAVTLWSHRRSNSRLFGVEERFPGELEMLRADNARVCVDCSS